MVHAPGSRRQRADDDTRRRFPGLAPLAFLVGGLVACDGEEPQDEGPAEVRQAAPPPARPDRGALAAAAFALDLGWPARAIEHLDGIPKGSWEVDWLRSRLVEPWREIASDAGPVERITFSPLGSWLLLGSGSPLSDLGGTVYLMDVVSGDVLHVFEGGRRNVHDGRFSPDDTRLLVVYDDGRLVCVDATSAAVLWRLAPGEGGAGAVRQAYFFDEGRRVVAWGDAQPLRVLDAATGEVLIAEDADDLRFGRLTFCADKGLLLSARERVGYSMWRIGEARVRQFRTVPSQEVLRGGVFDRDGAAVVGFHPSGGIVVWSRSTMMEPVVLDQHFARPTFARMHPTGSQFAVGYGDGRLELRDRRDGELVDLFSGNRAAPDDAAFSPEGSVLASVCREGTLRLWEIATAKLRATAALDDGGRYCLAWHPDAAVLAVANQDGVVRFFDGAAAYEPRAIGTVDSPARQLLFAGDGSLLFGYHEDGSLSLWSPARRAFLARATEAVDARRGVVATPDGDGLALGGEDGVVRLFDLTTAMPVGRSPEPMPPIRAFDHDGDALLLLDESGEVRAWDLVDDTTSPVASVPGGRAIAAVPTRLVVATDTEVVIVEREGSAQGARGTTRLAAEGEIERIHLDAAGAHLACLRGDGRVAIARLTSGAPGWRLLEATDLRAIAFHPAGDRLAALDDRGRLHLFTSGGDPVLTLPAHGGPGVALSFDPAGRRLATLAEDRTGSLLLWDAEEPAIRHASRWESQVLYEDADVLVEGLLLSLESPQAAAAYLSADPDLEPPFRRAAREALLARSIDFTPGG